MRQQRFEITLVMTGPAKIMPRSVQRLAKQIKPHNHYSLYSDIKVKAHRIYKPRGMIHSVGISILATNWVGTCPPETAPQRAQSNILWTYKNRTGKRRQPAAVEKYTKTSFSCFCADLSVGSSMTNANVMWAVNACGFRCEGVREGCGAGCSGHQPA